MIATGRIEVGRIHSKVRETRRTGGGSIGIRIKIKMVAPVHEWRGMVGNRGLFDIGIVDPIFLLLRIGIKMGAPVNEFRGVMGIRGLFDIGIVDPIFLLENHTPRLSTGGVFPTLARGARKKEGLVVHGGDQSQRFEIRKL
jgi:hypothetical protein